MEEIEIETLYIQVFLTGRITKNPELYRLVRQKKRNEKSQKNTNKVYIIDLKSKNESSSLSLFMFINKTKRPSSSEVSTEKNFF